MNVKPVFAALLLGGNLFAQTPADSVTIQGTVSDFNGNPVDSCTVMWKSPSFRNVIQVMTDPKGHYSARIPKGKYQSVAACRMDVYLHTAKAEVPDEDRKLEFWAWDFIADRDTTLDIRFHRMEVYGLRVFRVPGGMPTYQIYVRPMSLTRLQQIMKQDFDKRNGGDLSEIRLETTQEDAKGIIMAPHTGQLKATVWIDGEEVPVLMKQEIKEYFGAKEYGNAYLLTVDRPKCETDLPYHIFKVELEDMEYGERGEGLYYMEKNSYVK